METRMHGSGRLAQAQAVRPAARPRRHRHPTCDAYNQHTEFLCGHGQGFLCPYCRQWHTVRSIRGARLLLGRPEWDWRRECLRLT